MKLKVWRVRAEMTQEEAAGRLGISQVSYSNIEAGRIRVSLKNLLKLFELFDVPESERAAVMKHISLENIMLKEIAQ